MVKRMPIFHTGNLYPKQNERRKYENIILHIEFFLEVISDEERSSKT